MELKEICEGISHTENVSYNPGRDFYLVVFLKDPVPGQRIKEIRARFARLGYTQARVETFRQRSCSHTYLMASRPER